MPTPTLSQGRNRLTFKSQGCALAADLYTPEGFDPARPHPAIVFCPPFNQVKEQMGAVYGRKMTERGFLFLSFDNVGYGESEGAIRNYENAHVKIETIHDAVSFLRTLPCVDAGRLYGIGGCAGGGYMGLAAVTDKRLKAIATVCGMMGNQTTVFAPMDREATVAFFTAANDARQTHYESGEPVYADMLGYEGVSPDDLPEGAVREGYDYYMTERAGAQTYPNYSNRSLANIMETNALADATLYAPYLYTPYLGVYGEKAMADTGPLTVAYFEAASEPKELFEVPGASHVDLYDIDEYVDQAVERIAAFFDAY